jgi:hypothetical protein
MMCRKVHEEYVMLKWCINVWKHGHDDYMERMHRAWCKTKMRTWDAELRSFGWESHRHQATRPFEWESHRHHETKTVWVRVPSASCVRPVGLKVLQHQACVARWWCLKCFIVNFHDRRINMPMSLDWTEHMYIVTASLHMIFYKEPCLIVLRYLYFLKVWKCLYLSIVIVP